MTEPSPRPTWATVTGILGMIVGAFGFLSSAQAVFVRPRTDPATMSSDLVRSLGKQASSVNVDALAQQMAKMMEVPDWFGDFIMAVGFLGIVVGAAYLCACVLLLATNRLGRPMFIGAASASIVTNAIKVIGAMVAATTAATSLIPGALLGALFDAILLFVVATSNRIGFEAPQDNLTSRSSAP